MYSNWSALFSAATVIMWRFVLEVSMDWIKCSERLPLEIDAVTPYKTELVIVSDGQSVGFAVFETGNGCGNPWRAFSVYSDYSGSIIYWRPLPQPPVEA